jgi:WD40 repeat protein
MMRSLTVQVLLWACTTTVLLAVPTRGEDQKITYDEHVKPIFREHCFTCHNSANAKSDLALDTYAGVMKGGSSGEVVLASDPDSSRLWMLVSHQEEPKMPPMQDKLADAKLELIKSWIIGGALENAGSTAKKPSKPRIDLASSGGAARPEGPAILPESLPRQPFFYSPKTRALTALAASPWAPLVAVAGHKQIVLYHSDSGELLGILPFPEGVPHVLRFSRSGSLLLAGGGRGGQSGKVVVFDVKTGQRVFEVGDELDVVLAADISEDHRRIALGGPLRVVRIYNTSDGSLVGEIRKHNEWITAIEFSPDGVLLATGDRNGDLYAWEAETIREYQTLKGHTAAVTAVSWRADSNILASSSEDGSVRLWEMENGQQVKTWTAHGGGCSWVAFAGDGRLVTAGRDKQVKTWDPSGGQQVVFAPFADMALRAVFTHDAARVVAGDWTGQVRAWNVGDGQAAFDLAMNPPTLEMLAQQAEQEAGQAAAEAESAAAEVAAAEQSLAVADAAFHQAAEALAKAQAAFEKAQADQGAAQSRKAAAEQTASAKRSAAEAARAKAAAAKQAADAAADVQTAQSTQ